MTYSQTILLITCFAGDSKSITGVDANIVYVSDMCKNSEQRDDQCGGLRTSIHWPLRLNKGMSIASLNINGLRTHIDEVALLIQNPGIRHGGVSLSTSGIL